MSEAFDKQGLYNRHNFDLAKFASREESRYTLQSILVTPTETVATDGHRLVRCSVTNSDINLNNFPVIPGCEYSAGEKFLYPVSACTEISKAIPKRTTIPVLGYAAPLKPVVDYNGKRLVGFVSTDLEMKRDIAVREPEGTFPNFEPEMPAADAEVIAKITVSAQYLAELCAYFAKLDGRGGARDAITITAYKPFGHGEAQDMTQVNSAVKIEGHNADNTQTAVALIMPMRA